MRIPMQKTVLSFAFTAAIASHGAHAGPTPTGYATEVTQIANNALLGAQQGILASIESTTIGQYIQTSTLVANSAIQLGYEIAQVYNLLTMLKQLPQHYLDLLRNRLGLHSFDELEQTLHACGELIRASNQLVSDFHVLHREVQVSEETIRRMRALGYEDFDARDYVGMVNALTAERHNDLAARAEMFNAAIVSAQANLKQIQQISQNTPALMGAVEGLAVLNGTATEMLTALRGLQAAVAMDGVTMTELARDANERMRERALMKEAAKEMLLTGFGTLTVSDNRDVPLFNPDPDQ